MKHKNIKWLVYRKDDDSFFFWHPDDAPPAVGVQSSLHELETARAERQRKAKRARDDTKQTAP